LARLALLAAAWIAGGACGCAHRGTDELGTGVWVRSFRIEGNQALSDGDILGRLATQKTGWWPFAPKKWFDQAAFDVDLRRIPAIYADHGYFDARVTSDKVTPLPDGAVEIVVIVDEGASTQITSVDIRGLPAGGERRARKLAHAEKVEPGHTFSYDGYSALRTGIDQQLRQEGHAYAQVSGDVGVDRDRHVAEVAVTATPGPEVRFGTTTVEGNGDIPAHALMSRVTFQPGDRYNPLDVSTTQAQIYDLGVFSSVRLELPRSPTDVADVRIVVTRGVLRELRVGGGFGADSARDEVHARFEYTRSNFFGGLRKLRLRLKPAWVLIPGILNLQRSGPAVESDIQLTQPDLFSSRVSLYALAGWDLEVYDAYQYYGPRAQLAIDRPFYRNRLLAGLSWNLQYLTFFDVSLDTFNQASSRFFGFENPYRLGYLEALGRVNLRFPPLSPDRGGYFLMRAELGDPALGGDFSYFKLTPDLRVYVPMAPRATLAMRALFGWLHPFNGQTSPTTRRYALGGPSTHRGFGFGRLSPQVPDSSGRLVTIGGDAQVLFSGEVRFDVTKIGGNWLGLNLFLDAGDVTPSLTTLDLGNLNYAIGPALTYQTPIGVLRADVGVRLNRLGDGNPDPNDRIAFHLAIGEAF
jgi:outer membrane protein assembly factor BamA